MEGYEIILEQLLKLPDSHKTGTINQIYMHCPVCNHPKPKLYVGLMKNSKLLGYDCKHCTFQGKVGPEFLNMVGIDSTISKEYLYDYKRNKKQIKTISPSTKMEKLNLKVPDYINPKDKIKIDYLENRLQKTITVSDLKKYKFILNFEDFFHYNNYDFLQFEKDYKQRNYLKYLAKEFSNHFVGTLSVDNNKINLRNIDSEHINKRYMVYAIDKSINNPYMYMPDIPIDLCTTNPVINMCEGNYDIIGVKERFIINESYNNVFVAVGTKKAYRRVLFQVLKMTGFLDAKINIYADNDVWNKSDTFIDHEVPIYREMFGEDIKIFDSITLTYNKLYKDFGDLSKPCKIESIVLK